MKHNRKETLSIDTSSVKTRASWCGVKPYTRVETPKTVYHRQGKGRTPRGER